MGGSNLAQGQAN